MDERTPESNDPSPFRRATRGDLAFAFFGSIVVGAISPAIPSLLLSSPSYFLAASMMCGFLGIIWGFLTVIVTAAVEGEHRRATTLWMFAIQSLFAMVVGRLVMLSADA